MKFIPDGISGVFLVDMAPVADDRGHFGRLFCRREFKDQGIDFSPVQASVSYNHRKGTLRGMHYQASPHLEGKLVRAVKGAVFDVALDLRPDSHTYLAWTGYELSAEKHHALYIPPGCAHGFLTLADDTEILYLIDPEYVPEASRVVRWDDPAFAIAWPASPSVISDRDRLAADFRS